MEANDLMKEYFRLKDESKRLKKERAEYNSTYNCNDCDFDRMVRYGEQEDFCDVCQIRHNYHVKLLKLSYQQRGILLKVRAIVK